MTIKELREMTGLSQAKFSKKYHISKRTLENWEQERRTTPEYVLFLLEAVIKNDIIK